MVGVIGVIMNSKFIIDLLLSEGWYEVKVRGSHHYFKHPDKKIKITVPHPKKDLPVGTANRILKDAQLK